MTTHHLDLLTEHGYSWTIDITGDSIRLDVFVEDTDEHEFRAKGESVDHLAELAVKCLGLNTGPAVTAFACIIHATCRHLGGDEWELVARDGAILQEGTTEALMSIGVIFPHGTDIETEAA